MVEALDGEHREALHLVVVAGVVAEGTLRRLVPGRDMAFEHDLGAGRCRQPVQIALDELGAGRREAVRRTRVRRASPEPG